MRIELNLDGVSVRGCRFIYAPKGQALEYAPLAANPYRGCGHKCAYCYVPTVIKMDRKVTMRTAANMLGVSRVAEATKLRGLYP